MLRLKFFSAPSLFVEAIAKNSSLCEIRQIQRSLVAFRSSSKNLWTYPNRCVLFAVTRTAVRPSSSERGKNVRFRQDPLKLAGGGRSDQQHVLAALVHQQAQRFHDVTIGRNLHHPAVRQFSDGRLTPLLWRDFA